MRPARSSWCACCHLKLKKDIRLRIRRVIASCRIFRRNKYRPARCWHIVAEYSIQNRGGCWWVSCIVAVYAESPRVLINALISATTIAVRSRTASSHRSFKLVPRGPAFISTTEASEDLPHRLHLISPSFPVAFSLIG
jgi:hypothetical protein